MDGLEVVKERQAPRSLHSTCTAHAHAQHMHMHMHSTSNTRRQSKKNTGAPGNRLNRAPLGDSGVRYLPLSAPPASGEYARSETLWRLAFGLVV